MSTVSVNRELATPRRLLHPAHGWKHVNRVPRIGLLRGEKMREFVLGFPQEELYLDAAPQPLQDVAMLMLDTGLRPGEAVSLEWPDVDVKLAEGAKYGHVRIRGVSLGTRRETSVWPRG